MRDDATNWKPKGRLSLAERIENMFSFLYAAPEGDLCQFSKDFLDEVKAAALRGCAVSETVQTEGEAMEWDMVVTELCHQLGAEDGENMQEMLWDAVRDAKRYRFLRSRLEVPGAVARFLALNNWHPSTVMQDVDASIDAAMLEAK